jgi:peptidoglycan/xylan/chitin deacetylase (PgdA/CDA1 family)
MTISVSGWQSPTWSRRTPRGHGRARSAVRPAEWLRSSLHSAVSVVGQCFGAGGILVYHGVGHDSFAPWMHVRVDVLRTQLRALRCHYEFISLTEFVERMRRGMPISGHLAVTFDDAYAGVCQVAGAVLEDLRIPATIFVCSSFAAEGSVFWWDVVERIRIDGDRRRWTEMLRPLGLESLHMDDPDVSERLKDRVQTRFAGRGGDLLRAWGITSLPALWRSGTVSELDKLAKNERIDFACHTSTHPALPFLDPEQQEREIRGSHEWLTERLPRVRPFLAYPYGLYNRDTPAIAHRCGMTAAFTIESRMPAGSEFPMHIPRLCVKESTGLRDVTRALSRVNRPLRILAHGRHPKLPS